MGYSFRPTAPRRSRRLTTVRRVRWSAVACCVMLLMAACGSRLSKQEILAQNTVSAGQSATARSQGSGQVGEVGSNGASGSAGQPGSGSVRQPGSGSVGQPGVGTDAAADGGAGDGGPSAGPAPGQGDTGAKPPIVVGFVASLSGFFGVSTRPVRDAWVAWEKMVNARGGINGHAVELLIADDGGNESRAVALVRDFVENRNAVAVSVFTASMGAVADYAEGKSVPIIGAGVFHPEWNENPMLFPPYPNIDGAEWGPARMSKNAGVASVATLYCVEAAGCQSYNNSFVAHAQAEGLEVVYQGQISTSQPDYTAECIQMSNAGAEAVRAITDATSLVRLAQSCGRQGYQPIWLMTAADDSMQQIPQFEGAIASLTAFPWFLRSGSPGVTEYVDAFQKYAPNRLTEGSMTQAVGWLSAKIFEKAAAGVSDRPTSQDILNGLWSMEGETLGGLAGAATARTFNRDQPTADTYCGFNVTMEGGTWVAPNGLAPTCR